MIKLFHKFKNNIQSISYNNFKNIVYQYNFCNDNEKDNILNCLKNWNNFIIFSLLYEKTLDKK